METQDQKKLQHSGFEGNSGSVHVCNKCGWPFPKPHPSAKLRRAHKKVCGTIEGYKLDASDTQEKTQLMEGSDGEHISDDEHKTPSDKVVERTISKRSSNASGVGSRSSRSNRSEDEMFSDAVTDFTDAPSPGGEAGGGIQRFYSMQRVTQNDLDDIKHAAEKADADSAPSILRNDSQDQVQPVLKQDGENNRVEAGILPQDHISHSTSGPALVSASVAIGHEVEGETADDSKENLLLSREKSELRTYNGTSEEPSEGIPVLRDVNDDILGPVSAGEIAKSTGMETTGSENNIECSQVVDHPVEVIDPMNGSSAKSSDVREDHGTKSGADEDVDVLSVPDALPLHRHHETAVEDLDHKRGKFNKSKTPGSGFGTDSVEYGIGKELCFGIDHTMISDSKKVYPGDDALESVDAMENKLNQDIGHKSIAEQNPVGVPVLLLGVEASDVDASEFRSEVVSEFMTGNLEGKKLSSVEEQKPIVALNNVFPEDDSSVGADNPEFTLNEAAISSDSVKNNTEHVVLLQGIDNSEVSGRSEVVSDSKIKNLEEKKVSCADEENPIIALNSVFPEAASSAVADNSELTSNGATNATNSAEEEKPIVALNVSPEAASSVLADNSEFTLYGDANTSNSVENKTEHVFLQETDGSKMPGSLLLAEHATNDIPPKFKELSNIHNRSGVGDGENNGVVQSHLNGSEIRNRDEDNEAVNAETVSGCGLSTAGSHGAHESIDLDHPQPILESTGGGGAECTGEDGPCAIPEIDNLTGSISKMISSDASEVCDDAQYSLQTSVAINDTCTKKFAEEASGVVEGAKPHIADSGTDVPPDSSSQSDSLEGNWGSVSVMSAVSDTPPANDTPAAKSQASAAKENASLELKPMLGSQHSESKTPVEPQIGIGTMEAVSEIQTLEEQKERGSALQTSWSSSVAHLDNAPPGGKRNEEIIAKVTNWSADKQHMPLKTLLGEATARSRAESPLHTQMKPQTDETPLANNGFSKTESLTLSPNNPNSEASKEEMGKEWNSPARYPVNIKTEKRKTKSRPYWAPFLCCSSVNAR